MDSNAAAAGAGGASHIPIYISSGDDDPYSPDDVEIQEAILLSLNSSCATTASASSAHTDVSIVLETPPDCKGKRKRSLEGTSFKCRRCETVILAFRPQLF
jgi:E3 ubiquitin-protein ligase RNF144